MIQQCKCSNQLGIEVLTRAPLQLFIEKLCSLRIERMNDYPGVISVFKVE